MVRGQGPRRLPGGGFSGPKPKEYILNRKSSIARVSVCLPCRFGAFSQQRTQEASRETSATSAVSESRRGDIPLAITGPFSYSVALLLGQCMRWLIGRLRPNMPELIASETEVCVKSRKQT